jgi:hypothetical protein
VIQFLDGDKLPNGRFRAGKVSYGGKRYQLAVVAVGTYMEQLGLADTSRCAVDIEAAKETVRALVDRAKVHASPAEIDGGAFALQAHCRKLTGWKPRDARY